MRILIAALAVLVFVAPVDAKKRKRPPPRKTPKVRVVKDDSAAKDAAKAEEQLSELRGAKELAAPAPEPVSPAWVPQDSDKEVPSGLKKK